jgi:hypothetical protein
MTARTAAVALSLALTAAISTWLLAQFALSAAAGRDLAEIARQGARILPFTQLLTLSLVAPWLSDAASAGRAVISILIFALTPLPLQTLLLLVAGTPVAAAALGLSSVLVWGLLLAAAAALLRRVGMPTLAPLALGLLQAGAAVLAWRTAGDWIEWIGVP